MQQYNFHNPGSSQVSPSLLSLTPPAVSAELLSAEYRALWGGSEDAGPYLSLLPHASLKVCLDVSKQVVAELNGRHSKPLFVGACLDLAARLAESKEFRPEAKLLLDKALSDSRRIKDRYLEMYALIQLADINDHEGFSAQALQLYEEGVSLFRSNFSDDSPKLLPLVAVKVRLYQDIGLTADLEESRQQVKKLLKLHPESLEACEAWGELGDSVELEGISFGTAGAGDEKVYVALEQIDARSGVTAAPALSRFLQAQHKASFGHFAEAKGLLLTALLMLDDEQLSKADLGLLTGIAGELASVCLERHELAEAEVYSAYATRLLTGSGLSDLMLQQSIYETRLRVLEAGESTGVEWEALRALLLKLNMRPDEP